MGSPNINGREYSWASIEIRTDGEAPIVGCVAIKYGDGVEEGMVYGASRQPIGRTRGKYKPEDSSVTLLESAFRQVSSVPGWMDRIRTITVQYSEPGMPTHTDVIEGARFLGAEGGGEEGTDALKREVKMSFLKLKRNGVYAIAEMR